MNSLSSTPTSGADPAKLPEVEGFDFEKYRESEEARKVVAWVRSEYERSRANRQQRQSQWWMNMAMFYGQQWVEQNKSLNLPGQFKDAFLTPRKPYYHQRKVVNRTRAFVRWELSKFLSQTPTVTAVPGSGEDEDIRAAYAAEQAFTSISQTKRLRAHFARAAWWTIVTGNGFLKTYWDTSCVDKLTGEPGDIKYGSVTPFHLFVPDLREQEIEDQPFVINAYNRGVEWVYRYYEKELGGRSLAASVSSANDILEEGYLNLASPKKPDSVTIYEAWVKPGATRLLPEGGVVIIVNDILITMTHGFPYKHGEYPFTKFEHIPTATFYADSPLVDLNNLQKEYNTLRSEIHEAGKRMARPQLLAPKGSITPSKMTNEPGLVIEYNPGFAPPSPLTLSPLPQYYVDQQDRVLNDWEDISGEKEVSRGSAPSGVTAGTAINYLQEAANQYLTPQYQSIEQGYEKLGGQTIGLFVQYVDLPRMIRTVGADGAFDTIQLKGSDIAAGTDIRVEHGSAVGKSRAAQDAKAMDMFSVGMIDQQQALKLMEVNGFQKMQDTINVAEKKAQRENIKLKKLKPQELELKKAEQMEQVLGQLQKMPDGIEMLSDPAVIEEIESLPAPLMVAVADFDMHEVHIETHNRFRMSQEYESLPEEIKDQFDQHVAQHEAYVQMEQQKMMMEQFAMQGGEEAPADMGAESEEPVGPGASMSANGAAPEAPTTEGGA